MNKFILHAAIQQGAVLNPVIPFTEQYQALYDSLTQAPSAYIAGVQNTFVKTLVDNSVYEKLVCLMPLSGGMPLAADALKWWNNPLRAGTLVQTPSYILGQGFKGNKTDAAIDTTFNPTADGGALFTQNNASVGFHFYNSRLTKDDTQSNGYYDSSNTRGIYLVPRGALYTISAFNSIERASIIQNTNRLFTLNRTGSASWDIYSDKTDIGDGTRASEPLINATLKLLAKDTDGTLGSFSDDTVGLFFAGNTLTADDVGIIVDAYYQMIVNVFNAPVFTDDCNDNSIDTLKWTITNTDETVATFEETDTLKMNSLKGVGTSVYNHMIEANNARPFGVWRFSVSDAGLAGESEILREVGLINSTANRIRLYSASGVMSLQIHAENSLVYTISSIVTNFAQIKIVITHDSQIKIYKWISDAWVQQGETKTYNLGDLRFYMGTWGRGYALTQLSDIDITTYDYNTLRP